MLLYAANAAAVQWGGSPFLYCYGRNLAAIVYGPMLTVASLGGLGWMAYRIARNDIWGALTGAFIVLLAFGMPQFATIIFKLDGTCG